MASKDENKRKYVDGGAIKEAKGDGIVWVSECVYMVAKKIKKRGGNFDFIFLGIDPRR
jgi:hypothetical protein